MPATVWHYLVKQSKSELAELSFIVFVSCKGKPEGPSSQNFSENKCMQSWEILIFKKCYLALPPVGPHGDLQQNLHTKIKLD